MVHGTSFNAMLNHATLLRLVQDMAPRLVGGQIQKIRHPRPVDRLSTRAPSGRNNQSDPLVSSRRAAFAETDALRPNHTLQARL